MLDMILKKMDIVNQVKVAETGPDALEFLKKERDAPELIFLDINMPSMTGWEFLEYFDKLDDIIKNHFKIYILSSSVDQRDKDKANTNSYIKGFISKPLTREIILSVAT